MSLQVMGSGLRSVLSLPPTLSLPTLVNEPCGLGPASSPEIRGYKDILISSLLWVIPDDAIATQELLPGPGQLPVLRSGPAGSPFKAEQKALVVS